MKEHETLVLLATPISLQGWACSLNFTNLNVVPNNV